jgi:hypothetical protein
VLRFFRKQSIDLVYDKEPEWRKPGNANLSGYQQRW